MAVLQTGRSRKAGRVHLLLILCEVCTIFCLQPHCFHLRHVFIFALPDPRVSNASHAPSSYLSQKSRKRVRLSSPLPSPSHSRRGSVANSNAQGVGTWSSRNSSRTNASSSMQQASTSSPPQRTASRASHARSASLTPPAGRQQTRRSISVISQSSIPISAIISPHPPSIDRLSKFHVRDPKRPPPKRPVAWTLRLRTEDDHGSPRQAWCFWLGFLLPILWWIASLWPIAKTRILDAEKSIPVDDPNVEHGELHKLSLFRRF